MIAPAIKSPLRLRSSASYQIPHASPSLSMITYLFRPYTRCVTQPLIYEIAPTSQSLESEPIESSSYYIPTPSIVHSFTIPPVKPNIQYLIPYQRSVLAPYPLRPRKSAWSTSCHVQSRYIPHQQPIPFSAGHRPHQNSQPLDPSIIVLKPRSRTRKSFNQGHHDPFPNSTLSHKPCPRDLPPTRVPSLALLISASHDRRLLPIILPLSHTPPSTNEFPHHVNTRNHVIRRAMKPQCLLEAVPSPSAVFPLVWPNCASLETVLEGDTYSRYSVLHLFRGPIGL